MSARRPLSPALLVRVVLYLALFLVVALIGFSRIDVETLFRDEAALGPLALIDKAQLRSGRRLYEINCAQCHGTEARTDEPRRDLLQGPPDRAGFFKAVREGRPGMPAYDGLLAAQEIEDIFWYLEVTRAARER
ncbi:MAG: c-type cytochrome [Alphaproteobacteria bacterium]|nr:c-type cytochrome [Alphaproteobacteria bacterium]